MVDRYQVFPPAEGPRKCTLAADQWRILCKDVYRLAKAGDQGADVAELVKLIRLDLAEDAESKDESAPHSPIAGLDDELSMGDGSDVELLGAPCTCAKCSGLATEASDPVDQGEVVHVASDGEGERLAIPATGRGEQKLDTLEVRVAMEPTSEEEIEKAPAKMRLKVRGKTSVATLLARAKVKKETKEKEQKERKTKAARRKAKTEGKTTKEKKARVKVGGKLSKKSEQTLARAAKRRGNDNVDLPIQVYRRMPSAKRHAECYLVDAYSSYIVGLTSNASGKYEDIILRIEDLFNKGDLKTRSAAKKKVKAFLVE